MYVSKRVLKLNASSLHENCRAVILFKFVNAEKSSR